MSDIDITIKQACINDIKAIEEIYLDVVNWLDSINKPLWSKEQVSKERLLKDFLPEEFYIAYINNNPAGCMVLQDYAPFFWFEPIEKGKSLFLRRLAVKRFASGKNFSRYLLDYAVNKCREQNIKTLRLDCDADNQYLKRIYEDFGFILENQKTMIIGGKEYHISFYVYYI